MTEQDRGAEDVMERALSAYGVRECLRALARCIYVRGDVSLAGKLRAAMAGLTDNKTPDP